MGRIKTTQTYRIVKDNTGYAVHGVTYEGKRLVRVDTFPTDIQADTPQELREILKTIAREIKAPILDYNKIKDRM